MPLTTVRVILLVHQGVMRALVEESVRLLQTLLLPFGNAFLVACPHDGLDVSADVEVAFDFDAQGIAGGDEVFEDDVDYVLVEDFDVAERIYVELQTL